MGSSNSDQKIILTFWPKTAVSWLEFLLKVLVVTGSLGAIYQYFDVKQENRVKKTMEFLENFSNSDNLQKARLKLSESWEGYYPEIGILNDAIILNDAMIDNETSSALILKRIVLPVVSVNKQQQDIDLLVEFFAILQICNVSKICDEHTSKIFFDDYAVSFFNLYKPWIEQKREVIPTYACQLQAFATQTPCPK